MLYYAPQYGIDHKVRLYRLDYEILHPRKEDQSDDTHKNDIRISRSQNRIYV